MHHDLLQFYGNTKSSLVDGSANQIAGWRLCCEGWGPHQDVILHHVFGVEWAHVPLPVLQLRQIAQDAAIDGRGLGDTRRVCHKERREGRRR